MWPFKKRKSVGEVCGYIDINGKFFEDIKDRDKSNYEIRYSILNRKLESDLSALAGRVGIDSYVQLNIRNFIDTVAKYQLLHEMVSRYNKYLVELDKIKQL